MTATEPEALAPSARARELVHGAFDMHIHVAPDVVPRRVDDLTLARRFHEVGLDGFVLKSHYTSTAERASVVRAAVPGVMAMGSITLNRSVGGMNAWATSRCGSYERLAPSGIGNKNPALLSNGSPETELKRPFHISAGKNAVFRTIGARRMFLGPARSGPTIPLLSIPIAIGWLSPKPFVGE